MGLTPCRRKIQIKIFMDRKSIVVIVLAIVVFVWANNKSRQEQLLHQKPQVAAEATATPAATATATAAPTAKAEEPLPTAPVAPKSAVAIPEEKKTVPTESVDYSFTNLGGGIASLTLKNHQGANPGDKMVLNSAASHPIGALLEKPDSFENDGYTVTVEGKDKVICEKTTPSGIQVRKVYTLGTKPGEEYRVALEVSFTNRGDRIENQPNYFLFVGAAAPLHAADLPIYIGFDWSDGKTNSFIAPGWFAAGKSTAVGCARICPPMWRPRLRRRFRTCVGWHSEKGHSGIHWQEECSVPRRR